MPDLLERFLSVLSPARPDPALLAASLFTTGGGARPPSQPFAGVPLPTRPPVPPLPLRGPSPSMAGSGFEIPNVHSAFDPETGRFRGAPPADAGGSAATVPPVPMRRPEPSAPPLPTRRPRPPEIPGTLVDMSIPTGGLLDAQQDGRPGLMQVAGQSGLMSQLRDVLGAAPRVFDGVGGPAQGTPQPPVPTPVVAPRLGGPVDTRLTPPTPSPAITGKDVAGFFRNLARGAAGVDPAAPPLSAFAKGMAGSMVGMDKEAREAAAAEAAADDRQFERRMKTTDARLAQAKERRQARSAEIANTKAVTEIMRNLGGDLTTDQKFKFEGLLTDYAGAVNKGGLMQPDELKKALEAKRAELERNFGLKPSGGAGGPPPPPTAGQVLNGYRFKGGNPADSNNWEKVS